MTEDELRELAGYGGADEIAFAGQQWKCHPDPLAALLRYALAQASANPDEPSGALSALHRLLQDCIVDFAAFSEAVLAAKGGLEEVQAIARAVVEHCCARKFWPALRLLSFLATSMGEVDGNLIRTTGRGLSALTAREACNLALATCLDGKDDEGREAFFIDLNYEGSPEADALAALREYRAQQQAEAMDSG